MSHYETEYVAGFGDQHEEARLAPLVCPPGDAFKFQQSLPVIERLMSRLAFGASDCWHWRGARSHDGYGTMRAMGEQKASRIAWKLFHGAIPAGMLVLHRCDNPACVNPEHLFLGTQLDNMKDMKAKGRRKGIGAGASNGRAKLTSEQVTRIRRLTEFGVPRKELSQQFGVSRSSIDRIIKNQSWRAV